MQPRRAPLLPYAFALLVFGAAPLAGAAELFEVTAAGPVKATAGAQGKASVVLQGKSGWHLNEQAPVTLKLKAPAGVAVPKESLGRKDLVESTKDKARFEVAFTASEPGPKTIDGEASFVICQESACKPVKEKVALALDVAAPEAAPAAAPKKARAKARAKQ